MKFMLLCNRCTSFKRSVNAGIRDIIYTYGCTKMRWVVTGLPWQSWQWLEWRASRANASFLEVAGPTTYPQSDQKWIAQSIPTWRFFSYLYCSWLVAESFGIFQPSDAAYDSSQLIHIILFSREYQKALLRNKGRNCMALRSQ